jgi:hypothetical protein
MLLLTTSCNSPRLNYRPWILKIRLEDAAIDSGDAGVFVSAFPADCALRRILQNFK